MRSYKLFVAGIVVALAGPAIADTRVTTSRTDKYFTGNGGEFTLAPLDNLVGPVITGTFSDIASLPGTFQSFCVETNEHISGNPETHYVDINTYATLGGAGGRVSGGPHGTTIDPLDAKTAYLYTKFRSGSLAGSGYNYNTSGPTPWRDSTAGALQEAIWAIEQEQSVGALTGLAKAFYDESVEATTLGADGKITWTGIGSVRVLNLYGDAGRTDYRQDVLCTIPEPGAGLLVLASLSLIPGFRRRRA